METRPCVVISPDEMNTALDTVIIAPLTSTIRSYPTRITVNVMGKKGQICLDQLRTVDQERLYKKISTLEQAARANVCDLLVEMFEL